MADAAPTLAALKAGDPVDGVFACTRKDRLVSRTGTPYLALELRDKSATLPARAFRSADVLAGRFDRGDLVQVRGRAERFRDELQVDVDAIRRVEAEAADPESFLPTAYRDLDELDGFLEALAGEVHDPPLAAMLGRMLADGELRAAWRRAPCTRRGHHSYLGGLLEHTVAVAQLCMELAPLHPKLDPDLLLAAALVHDLGRTREFTYGAEIGLTEEGRLLGHLTLGAQLVEGYARELPGPRRLALLHCLLAHHGPDQIASPAAPRFGSLEALALYRVNALDAAVKGGAQFGLG